MKVRFTMTTDISDKEVDTFFRERLNQIIDDHVLRRGVVIKTICHPHNGDIMDNEVTRDVEDYIKRWKFATEQVKRTKQQLSKAECELANATTDLAKCLLPRDAEANEQFCVWYGDSLIAVKHERGNHFVTLRTRGKSWEELLQ